MPNNALQIERFALGGANALCIRTRGRNCVAESRVYALRLCQRLIEEGATGCCSITATARLGTPCRNLRRSRRFSPSIFHAMW